MRLKRFNENESDLVEYINLCFIDLTDDDKVRFYTNKSGEYVGSIYLKMNYDGDKFDRYRDYYKLANIFIDRVEECVEKVKVKYPNIEFNLSIVGNIMDIKFNIEK